MARGWMASLWLAALLLGTAARPRARQKRKVVFFISGSSKFGTDPSRTFEKQILDAMDIFATELLKLKSKQETTIAVYWGKKPNQPYVHHAASFTDSKKYLLNRRMRPFLDKVKNDQKYSSGEYSGLDGVIRYSIPNIYKRPVDAIKVAIFFLNSDIDMKQDFSKIFNDSMAHKLIKVVVLFKWPNENCDNETISSKLLTLRTQETVDLAYCDGDLGNETSIDSQLDTAQQRADLWMVTTTTTTTTVVKKCDGIICQLWWSIPGIILIVLILLALLLALVIRVAHCGNKRNGMRRLK